MGAIIGALLVAGSVAANAADLPLVSSLPLVGNGQQQAAAVPEHAATPQMGSSNASPRHEATAQKVLVSKDAHSGYSGDRHGDNGDDPSVVMGNTSTNAPVNDCGNPVNDAMGIAAAAQCDNEQNSVSAGSVDADGSDGPSVVVGDGSGLDTETLQGNTDTNTPMNTCGNPMGGGGVVTGAQCRNRQNHVAVGDAG